MFFLPKQKKRIHKPWLSLCVAFFIYIAMPSKSWSDFDMTFVIPQANWGGPPITITNRQPAQGTANYLWNDDVFDVVAVGFNTTSTTTSPATFDTLSTDMYGGKQYRFPILYATININPGATGNTSAGGVNSSLTGNLAYPQFPHIVVREKPAWGPLYPDTTTYAPPVNATDINAATGALSNADYYNPAAWVAHDDAPLTVVTTGATAQHPTQLWIGMPIMPKNTMVNDSACNCNDYPGVMAMQVTNALGIQFMPNNLTGLSGPAYTPTNGAVAPAGLMWVMSAAWVQEFTGYNMRVPLVIGSRETGMGLFYQGDAGQGFPDGTYAGSNQASVGTFGVPYQFVGGGPGADGTDSITGFPDYWTQANANFVPYGNAANAPGNYGIITHTIALICDLSSRYYNYFASARSLKLNQLAASSRDPYLLLKTVAYGYNQGPYTGNIWLMGCGNAHRTTAINSTNVAVSNGITGFSSYASTVSDLSRRIGRDTTVYDWGITWGDVLSFLNDLRTNNFANGVPSNADWTSMTNELQTAFNAMAGKSPNVLSDGTMVGPTRISFRYNWLTMLRIMKKWLPQPRMYLAKGEDMNDQIGNYGGYDSTATAFTSSTESSPTLCSANHLAPEIYWTNPAYAAPWPTQSFAPITICNTSPIPLAADVKYYNDDSTSLTVRWALSPGDPTAGGYSIWHDAFKTGGIIGDIATQLTDWSNLAAGGAGAVAGSTHYTGSVPVAGITGLRRIYMDADDGDGFRTISWVDVYLKSCVVSTNTMTATNTNTQTQTATNTPTMTQTNTNSPTPSPTNSSTNTSTVTNTVTSSPTATSTDSPTSTPTSTNTVPSTSTMTPTNSPTATQSSTSTATAVNSFTATLTSTVSQTGTSTETVTMTPTPLANTATNTVTTTDTATAQSTSTFTATVQSTNTQTLTETETNTATATDSSTPLADTATSTATSSGTATSQATNTSTLSATGTGTFTPTMTSTATLQSTATSTLTATATRRSTSTMTATSTVPFTFTPTYTPVPDNFFISKNVFTQDGGVEINVGIDRVPGYYDLSIYNSAGEHIQTLDHKYLTQPFAQTYTWNGKNKYGAQCAAGIYVIYATYPFKRLLGRVVLLHR